MKATMKKLGAIQNLGLVDRAIRVLIATGFLLVVSLDTLNQSFLGWHAILPLIAIYPFLTGILGWDPIYSLGHFKTCDTSSRNRCGTFPFEVEAATGHKVECGDGYDCSATAVKHSHSHS